MALQPALCLVFETLQHRPTDDVRARCLGGAHHQFKPVALRRSRRRRSSDNCVAAGNVARAVSNAALMAWQFPCRGSTTQSPGNLPDAQKFAGDRRAARTPTASFSTMTTAKRRSVR